MRRFLITLFLLIPVLAVAQDLPTIETKTEGMQKLDGYFPLYWDAKGGNVWLEVPRFNEEFLYVVSLPAGLGSNDVGLDRGQLGPRRIVYFERVGPKILMIAPNMRYRADSDNELERKAVRDAFAESVAWSFKAEAETEGRVLVNATSFIVRDAHGVVGRLRGSRQGSFRLDANRSAPYLAMTKAFPENTEMEARLTFLSDSPGGYVRSVAADPSAVTLRVRHSFLMLPDMTGYTPREMDPRSGYFGLNYVDYATPIGERKEKQFINRHRLQKRDPAAERSEAIEPIVYYLDPGTPEPVRSALLDGARWWNEAFEAAGFIDGFQVEVLPDTADMMDARYNVIQWVHRSTRGWSYGSSVSDPRTGEIIKGHVSLGSLRVRQDYLLAEGLLAPYTDGTPPADDPMLQMALARIRQLSAHEIGHTLGIAHNFAASANNRASVMDYPAPLATLDNNGNITLNEAYDVGIGEWDKIAVRYGYTHFAPGTDEKAALNAILAEAHANGLYYITDSDARAQGGAHPLAHLWDNGANAIDALDNEMAVRQKALSTFGLNTIRNGRPLATLEEVLVPLYLRHRYQVEGTVKLIGGVSYDYTLRGDARALPEPVPATMQDAALDALLNTLTPDMLALPEQIRTQIPPRPPGYGSTRELFDGYTGPTFDPYTPAETVAHLVLGLILHPQRAARLQYQADMDSDLTSLETALDRIWDGVWTPPRTDNAYHAELQRIVQQVWTDQMLRLAGRSKLAPGVRARVTEQLRTTLAWLEENQPNRRDTEAIAHRNLIYDDIDRYLFRQYQPNTQPAQATTPPGSPIGSTLPAYVLRHEQREAFLDHWTDLHQVCAH